MEVIFGSGPQQESCLLMLSLTNWHFVLCHIGLFTVKVLLTMVMAAGGAFNWVNAWETDWFLACLGREEVKGANEISRVLWEIQCWRNRIFLTRHACSRSASKKSSLILVFYRNWAISIGVLSYWSQEITSMIGKCHSYIIWPESHH